jgi:hypothetical protein
LVVGAAVVVVVGGTVELVVVGGGAVVVVVGGTEVVVVVVVSGAARLNMSCENPKAACRPAAAPTPGGTVPVASASGAVEDGASRPASSLLGENAAKAAMARRAITTHVAKARSLVNLTPASFCLVNSNPRCASMRGIVWRLGAILSASQIAKSKQASGGQPTGSSEQPCRGGMFAANTSRTRLPDYPLASRCT